MPTGAELALEYFAAALETTRGTAITAPTHYIPLAGSITGSREKYRPEESRGTFARNYRSATVRTDAEWEAEGGADVNYLPFLANMVIKGVTSPTTPTNGVLTRLWTFTPTMNADNIKSATMWFGDPNVQIFRSAFCVAEELTISADASGTDGVTMAINGMGNYPTRVSAPTLPSMAVGSLLAPSGIQLWIDTSSAIGTTEVSGRVVSTEWAIPTGVSTKHFATGPGASANYGRIGRGKRAATAQIVVELNDESIGSGKEYQLWEADTTVKMRIRISGQLIESVTPDYFEYVEFDIYGPLDAFEWGDLEGTNRTMQFTVESQYDSTLGADFSLKVQNQKTSL
jgi:hypothetical protein